MTRYDQSQAECLVFTFKEGLLSAVAHDLKLSVGAFTVDVDKDAGSISASFDVASIAVVNAQKDGKDVPRLLNDKDKRDIVKNIKKSVLKPRNPQITFSASDVDFDGTSFNISGDLKIEGRTRQVSIPVTREGDSLVAKLRFNQKDFGIKPFSAMMGTIKVKPEIEVVLTFPAS